MDSVAGRVKDYFDSQIAESKEERFLYDAEKARAIALAYIDYYADDGYECMGIEVPFTVPVYSPEAGKPTGRWYGGIVDAILYNAGEVWFCDHKTASRVDAAYWAELKTNSQLSQYLLAARQMGLKHVRGFLWDVIEKWSSTPNQITKSVYNEILDTGTYFNLPVSKQDIEWLENTPWKAKALKETPSLYGLRVLAKYTSEPEKFFHRRKLYRTDSDLFEYAEELEDISATIEVASNTNKRLIRNFGACKKFGSLCEFHQICCGEASADDPLVYETRSSDANNERVRPDKGALSISQINTYLTCPRQWQYRYRERLQKVGREYQSALEFGTMVHYAIELFLRGRMADKQIKFPNKIKQKNK